jgi:hypothetical protein
MNKKLKTIMAILFLTSSLKAEKDYGAQRYQKLHDYTALIDANFGANFRTTFVAGRFEPFANVGFSVLPIKSGFINETNNSIGGIVQNVNYLTPNTAINLQAGADIAITPRNKVGLSTSSIWAGTRFSKNKQSFDVKHQFTPSVELSVGGFKPSDKNIKEN